MMAFSGARGNLSQVRQLVGMRGLMSDPQGQIIDLPISSNFREGLTVTDYFISSYGARKGLVDTALRTADSGYLTRRLVDVAQDVIIRELDCKTSKGILLEDIVDNKKILIGLEQSLIGRVLAEDIINPSNNILIGSINQDIDDLLAENIIKANINKVLVRSPITCNASNSVCQKCYGWNLAHGRLVDLGEAVGIIAAQSIGEPGTQLTMRTFHTGGVFTGEFADRIFSPYEGIVKHPEISSLTFTRTRHGDKAYLVKKDCYIILYDKNKEKQQKISLSKNSLLLVDNMAYVSKHQVIAEYPLKSRLVTEKAQKSILADISGKIAFTNLTIEEIENKQHIVRSAKSGGLIWILSGNVHTIPDNADLVVNKGQLINSGSMLAITKIISNYSGYIEILPKNSTKSNEEIRIITSSQTLKNVIISLENYYLSKSYFLETYNGDKFLLRIKSEDRIINGQIIGELVSDVYKTHTGGIIKYLDLPVSKKKTSLTNEYYNILGAGYILWISEETHELNKDSSLLLVKHGDFIDSGTEIIKNIYANNSGIVQVIEKDGIVKEIVIKPCTIYNIDEDILLNQNLKKRGFLRPGEKIVKNIITNKLVYWEYLDIYNGKVLLIRPVVVYSIPNKNYAFTYTSDSFQIDSINLCLRRQINFKDGARVKSVQGIDLIKTYLTIEIAQNYLNLNCFVNFIYSNNSKINLKFILADTIIIKDTLYSSEASQVVSNNRLLVLNNSFINKGDPIAQTELLSNISGEIIDIQKSQQYNRRFLILTNADKHICPINLSSTVMVNLYDWVYKDQEIAKGIYSLKSGQVIHIDTMKIIIRIGRPYLISNGSILHVDHNNLVQKGENIATLIFKRNKTGDIVQGLPRIEEILEARKKVDSNFNPHLLLENKFHFYLKLGLSLHDATRMSVQEIQLLLVKEVQLVYQSQGVDISDKHIEVIVKQMTSKVKIEKGGDTNHLPKASLNTASFISAASFQETTKVLTEAAISGKLDWLKGLKENVIIGRLIPAGTGFNSYNSNVNNYRSNNHQLQYTNINQAPSQVIDNHFEDIILDDREARNLTNFKQNLKDLQPKTDII